MIYKNLLPSLDGYLTSSGKIKFDNVDVLFRDISKLEEEQFKLQYVKAQRSKERENAMKLKPMLK